MPTNKLLLLQLTISLTILLSHSAAYQSCSSLKFPSNGSPNPFRELSKGCTIEPLDEFTIELPLIDPSSPNKVSQLHFHLTNSNDHLHINLTPGLESNNYDLEFIFPGTREIYSIPTSTCSLRLSINRGTFTISIEGSSITLSRALSDISPYILSLQLPNEGVISQSKPTIKSLRMLSQCSEGLFLVEGTCQRTCPARQYEHNGVCSRCPDKCYTGRCVSDMLCNPCKTNEVFSKEQGKCVEKCPETYFEDYNNRVCVKCAEGCVSCSFPNGLCSASYFKNDMIINIAVSMVLLGLITLCACCCNKEKADPTKTTEEQQQAQQSQENTNAKAKAKGTSEHVKQLAGVDPQAPYVVLPEVFSFENEEEEGSDKGEGRRRKRRLNQFAETKLLTLSVQKKGFMINDADEDKAISHGSGSRLNVQKLSSATSLTSKDSPLFKTKRKDSKHTLHSAFAAGQQRSYGELASPYSAVSGLMARQQTSLGMTVSKDNGDGLMFLDILNEEREQGETNVETQVPKPSLQLLEFDKRTKTVEEAGEFEELEDLEEKEGYRNDSSLSMSKDKEGMNDMYACTICGMNKRDCLNRPCGHVVGCHACMEQFKESYGVCPRCKKQLVMLEKVAR